MKVLLIGSGGREHSLARSLKASPKLSALYTAPGNPGTAQCGENVPISDSDIEGLLQFAKDNAIDMTMVGPEAPLALGIVDRFDAEGLAIVGPCAEAAQMESSKAWAKKFMMDCGIPTAGYHVFEDHDQALSYIQNQATFPTVIKADGLAAGKGVTVCFSLEEAQDTLQKMMKDKVFAEAGSRVVIEDFLKGEEASILAFTDGETILPLESAQDHKPVFDNDKGPNTGGMGAYSPAPIVTPEVLQKVQAQILEPLLKGMKDRGISLKGIVYAGLMIDNGEPSVVEFNMRFGDPETQVVLARLQTDLLDVFQAIVGQTLCSISLDWKDDAAVCVVMASEGYPDAYPKGKVIQGVGDVDSENTFVIHAGTTLQQITPTDSDEVSGTHNLTTNGGRVLGVVGMGPDVKSAIDTAYDSVAKIHFEGAHYRSDIGAKAIR